MSETDRGSTSTCRCGAIAFSMVGQPIVEATCHCESCAAAAHQIEEMGAGQIINADGGMDYVLFRKDRVMLLRGKASLIEHRLTPDSPTRRVVASCCHSPMFLDFALGHWLSIYRANLGAGGPRPEMRAHSARFFLKLIGAWVAMGFRRPKLPF